MGEAQEIVIGRIDDNRIIVRLGEPDYDGGRTGKVEVHAGPWSGISHCEFFPGELGNFATAIECLHQTLAGSAELKPMERYLELKFIGDGKGHILVEAQVRDGFLYEASVSFHIALDQTELPEIVAAFKRC